MIQVMLRTQKNIKSFACNVAPEARGILAGGGAAAAQPPEQYAIPHALRQERRTCQMVLSQRFVRRPVRTRNVLHSGSGGCG